MRRDIADRLQSLVVQRFREEQPDRELSKGEIENIWFSIYGMLCHGKTEGEVEAYCKTLNLRKSKTHADNRSGY